MSLRRFTLFYLLLAGACAALAPTCLANRKAYLDHFAAPVQNYAVVDLSGTEVSGAVSLMALNDGNQAAFAFPTGTQPPYCRNWYARWHVYTWSNGTLGGEKIVECYEPADWPDDGTSPPTGSVKSDSFDQLLATGWLYGGEVVDYVDVASLYWTIAFAQSGHPGTMDLPSPPFENMSARHHDNTGSYLNTVSAGGGVIGGRLKAAPIGTDPYMFPWASDCCFVLSQGAYTVFDPRGDYSHTTLPANVVIVPQEFYPARANEKGWAVGGTSSWSWENATLWDGHGLRPLGAGFASGINDQGQVIVEGYHQQSANTEGYLWEAGNALALRDTLPFFYQWWVSNIQPFSLSNQAKEGPPPPNAPDPGADPTIHLLADADELEANASGKTV